MNDHHDLPPMTAPVDRGARAAAQAPIPWDDLRHQRVLARIEAARAQQRSTRPRRGWVAASIGAAVAVAAAVVVVLAWPKAAVDEPMGIEVADALAPTTQALPSIPFEASPQLRLPDNSVAQLRNGARVDVELQQADVVRLLQHSGEVRYQVTPNRARDFIVDAAGVEVRVVGTIFTVRLDDDPPRVAVSVERGLVEVDNGTRVAELGPGDALSVERDDDDIAIEPESPDDQPPKTATHRPPAPSIEALLDDADRARASGDLARAASALRELVRRYRHDSRAYGALFQLGKVERARGHHGAAAQAFARCWKRSPRGALAEDARAEAAIAWHAAGRSERAHEAAREYLARYPQGTHRGRIETILATRP